MSDEPVIPMEQIISIDMDGEVNDSPLLNALGTEFAGASDKTALEIAMMLQQLVRGQNSLLAQQAKFSEEISKLREQAVQRDLAMDKFKADQEKFLREAEARGERLRTSDPAELAKMSEKFRFNMGTELARAKVRRAQQAKAAQDRLAQEPRENLVSPGITEMQMVNGSITPVLLPEVIRYKNMAFTLPPGKVVSVPATIAALWRERQQSHEVKDALDATMGAGGSGFQARNQIEVMASKLAEINNQYGLKGQSVLNPAELPINVPL